MHSKQRTTHTKLGNMFTMHENMHTNLFFLNISHFLKEFWKYSFTFIMYKTCLNFGLTKSFKNHTFFSKSMQRTVHTKLVFMFSMQGIMLTMQKTVHNMQKVKNHILPEGFYRHSTKYLCLSVCHKTNFWLYELL